MGKKDETSMGCVAFFVGGIMGAILGAVGTMNNDSSVVAGLIGGFFSGGIGAAIFGIIADNTRL